MVSYVKTLSNVDYGFKLKLQIPFNRVKETSDSGQSFFDDSKIFLVDIRLFFQGFGYRRQE